MKKMLLLLLPLVLVSCLPQARSSTDILRENRQRWTAHQITEYRYTLQISCFCVPEMVQPVIIEVRKGVMHSITAAGSGAPVDPQYFSNFDTIDKLFDHIHQAIESRAAHLDVTYDSTFGYPIRVSIDYSKSIADEEISYMVSNFEKIK